LVECEDGEDEHENRCGSSYWYTLISVTAILIFFKLLFFVVLKITLKGKEKTVDITLQPVYDEEISLDDDNRLQFVLKLKAGGRDEARRIFQLYKVTHLKVCT